MDYRVKYRDIPWSVALGVLPGKIIGSWIINPSLNFKRNWQRILLCWLKFCGIILGSIIVLFVLFALLDNLLENDLVRWVQHLWGKLNG